MRSLLTKGSAIIIIIEKKKEKKKTEEVLISVIMYGGVAWVHVNMHEGRTVERGKKW